MHVGKMARDKEEELLNLPEFDETEFIRSEKNRAKAVIFFFLIGAALGLLAGYLFDIGLWYFSVILAFIFLLFLRFIMNALNLEMPKTGGQRIFLVMEFILTFIVFWILFLNPPLSVVSGPQVSNIQVQGSNGQWTGISQLSGNIYAWYVNNVSYRTYLYFVYPINSISVNELLYSGPPSLAASSILKSAYNVTHNYVNNHLYFNISKGFEPSSGKYLEIQISTEAHGHSSTYTFMLTIPSFASGYGTPETYYTSALFPAYYAGVV